MSYFMDAITKHYADFSGRARRTEYWMFALFYCLALLAALLLDSLFGTVALFYVIAIFGLLLPSIAVSVRRLHDLGKSGWFQLIILIPIVGGIWFLVLMCTDGNPANNEYGPNPKTVGPVSGSGQNRFCPSCGSPNAVAGAFCRQCGKALA